MPANFEPVITTTIPSIRSVMLTNNNSNCGSSMRHSSTYSRSASTSNMNKKKDKTKVIILFNNFTSCNPYYRKYPPFVDYGCYNRWSGLRSTALWVSYKPIPRIRDNKLCNLDYILMKTHDQARLTEIKNVLLRFLPVGKICYLQTPINSWFSLKKIFPHYEIKS